MSRIKNCGITMRRFKQLLAFALVFLLGFQLLNLINANFSKYNELENRLRIYDDKVASLKNSLLLKEKHVANLNSTFSNVLSDLSSLLVKQNKIVNNLKTEAAFIDNLIKENGVLPKEIAVGDIQNNLIKLKSLLNDVNLPKINSNTELFDKIIVNAYNENFEFPLVNDILPHLKGKIVDLSPSIKLSKQKYGTFVIGIPTVRREEVYLYDTIKSLLSCMNDYEKNETVIVVMIAEIDNSDYVKQITSRLETENKNELESGLLEIIQPPKQFYPDLDNLPPDELFSDKPERVKWRTKQNFDYSYLMTYAMKKGTYYLQLEDDIICSNQFLTVIKAVINRNDPKWLFMEFSKLGFIGKLFKTSDLPIFINTFLMFANQKPCDLLIEGILDVRTCINPQIDSRCKTLRSSYKISHKPSLFQHVGLKSSLKGKTQNLKDDMFRPSTRIVNNPPANLFTSLKVYESHSLENVYTGNGIFWSLSPENNDFILIEFNQPTLVKKYSIKSGNAEHPGDKLYNGLLEIKTEQPIPESKMPSFYKKDNDDFVIIDEIRNETNSFVGEINPDITGKLTKMRIKIPNSFKTWLLIEEINLA